MNSFEAVQSLVRHMEWADATLWRAVLDAPAAAADPKVRDLLRHQHMVQAGFLSVWRGQPFERDATATLEGAALARLGRRTHAELAGFVGSLGDADLEREVKLPWAERLAAQPGATVHLPTLQETVMQVAAHSTHHRAQAALRLREAGVKPPTCDFILWVVQGRPAPEWPAETA